MTLCKKKGGIEGVAHFHMAVNASYVKVLPFWLCGLKEDSGDGTRKYHKFHGSANL